MLDFVSLEGVHKCVAIWLYDRRSANGASFVCFGQRLVTMTDDPACQVLVAYQRKVLDALGIVNGPSHGEVMLIGEDEVCLVEVGARCHGAEGAWMEISQSVLGYNQVEVTLLAYLEPSSFTLIPDNPERRLGHYGRLCFFISYESGVVESVDEATMQDLLSLKSVTYAEIFPQAGTSLRPTIDCLSFGGIVKMINTSLEELVEDYEKLRNIENRQTLFVLLH